MKASMMRLGCVLLLIPLVMLVKEGEGYVFRPPLVFPKCHTDAKLHSCRVGCGIRGCTQTCRGYAYCHCYGDNTNIFKYYADCMCCDLE